ncbi:Protein-tyrosine-phosphatase MKP1 [Bienertia sinuspersici]
MPFLDCHSQICASNVNLDLVSKLWVIKGEVGMVGKEDDTSSWGEYQVCNNVPKKFWRSASWSASRTAAHNPDIDDKDNIDSNGNPGSNGIQGRRFPAPLTPRSQQNCKARSCLPPLQPLAIARRSLDEWPKAGSDDIGEWPGPPTPSGRDVNKGSERLKLDMSAIQTNSDRNGGFVKKDKIAFFDKECSKVAEHIYLGGDAVAKDRDILKKNGITHVLNCVGFVCPEYFRADFVYRTLWLQDSPSEDITSILYDVFDYFEDVREMKGKVFVHCCQGVSRSTSLVIAYLMWREGQSFDDAFQYVKDARGIADPNMGFACQLLQCQKRVHAFPLSPSSLLRVYRIAPHSPYDPLHLVPKMLNDPTISAFDSRGAFIVQVPSAIYVWLGKHCEVIMEREARGAVSQIVRYERVQVPAHVIKEGEEPPFFWDMFTDFAMDKCANGVAKIQPGERKLDSYDVDFEIFQKAIKGGFVPALASSEIGHETHLPARENSWSVLRRKFASGHMKEFVLAPKLVINKLHSDSRLNYNGDNILLNNSRLSDVTLVHSTSSSPSSVSSASLSSFSSPHLSPDSISSDSSNNTKCSSESPLDSPLSLSSAISNMSLHSSKNSTNVSNHPGYIEVNFGSHPLRSTNLPSRRSPLSIAERRGNLSRCLTLPIGVGDGRMQESPQELCDGRKDANINDDACISFELDKGGMIADCKNNSIQKDFDSDKIASKSSPRLKEAALASLSDKWKGNSTPTETAGLVTVVSMNCDPEQPSVYRLPNLEKVSISGAYELDSSSAFIVMAPGRATCPTKDSNIYLWVGKSFKLSKSQIHANRKVGDVDSTDWKQVGSDVLSRMGLPEDTNIKIIRGGEEPAEFLEALIIL